MTGTTPVIRVVAAVVLDADGRMLVVRKRGTSAFMQPGGKVEAGESSLAALEREVREELGVGFDASAVRPLGRYAAPAANERDHVVEAELFLVALAGNPLAAAEIDELDWVDPAAPGELELAPLTRDVVLTLVRDLADQPE